MTRTRKTISVTLHSYWHAGTGRSEGAGSDAVVARTPAGLPLLPGRTLKGLTRAAVEQALRLGWFQDLGGIDGPTVASWFGKPLPTLRDAQVDDRVAEIERPAYRHAKGEGLLRFMSATLGKGDDAQQWETWAASERRRDKDLLFRSFASTRIDGEGVAAEASLRVVELAVPLVLYATVAGPDGQPWAVALERAFPLVRALGSGRTRGLGRVTLKLESAP